jgi:hypothetical protein
MQQSLFGLVEKVLRTEVEKDQEKYEKDQRKANLRFVVQTHKIPDFQAASPSFGAMRA